MDEKGRRKRKRKPASKEQSQKSCSDSILLSYYSNCIEFFNFAARNMNLYSTLLVFGVSWNTAQSISLRNLADSSPSLIVTPVYQGDVHFYVDLHCGTPPQKQTVMINTDAPATVVPCTGCTDCGAHHTLFDQSGSMTFEQSHCSSPESCWGGETCATSSGTSFCTAGRHYFNGDHWYGKQVADFCFVGSETAVVRSEFACQTTASGVFRAQYPDGTLSLSRSSPQSFIAQLFHAGKISKEAFSLCLRSSIQERSSEAGALTLGGSNHRLHSTAMVYTEMQGEEHYGVHIRKIHLKTYGLRTLDVSEENLNEAPVVIESAFSNSYFTGAINDSFRSAWKELTGDSFDQQPRYVSYNQVAALPTIVIQISGTDKNPTSSSMLANDPDHPNDVLVEITPQQYMEYNDYTGEYINKFELSNNKIKRTVLGANVLRGYDVLFDSTNRRIGWAVSRCVLDEDGIPMPDSRPEESASEREGLCNSSCRSVGFVMLVMAVSAMLAVKLSLKKYIFYNNTYTAAPTGSMEFELRSVEYDNNYEQPPLTFSD